MERRGVASREVVGWCILSSFDVDKGGEVTLSDTPGIVVGVEWDAAEWDAVEE
jgi:hypothetical protein